MVLVADPARTRVSLMVLVRLVFEAAMAVLALSVMVWPSPVEPMRYPPAAPVAKVISPRLVDTALKVSVVCSPVGTAKAATSVVVAPGKFEVGFQLARS